MGKRRRWVQCWHHCSSTHKHQGQGPHPPNPHPEEVLSGSLWFIMSCELSFLRKRQIQRKTIGQRRQAGNNESLIGISALSEDKEEKSLVLMRMLAYLMGYWPSANKAELATPKLQNWKNILPSLFLSFPGDSGFSRSLSPSFLPTWGEDNITSFNWC